MLIFQARSPFSFEEFLKRCQGIIPDQDIELLRLVAEPNDFDYKDMQPTLKRWYESERKLKNELVKVRAQRKHIDPSKYLRGDEYAEPDIARIAMAAYRNTSFLEAEKMIDEKRWQVLEELAFGHYFDIDVLIVYALKLLILGRWERIRATDKERLLEENLVSTDKSSS